MDIEKSEWLSLEDILANGELRHVRQLLVEYHMNAGDQIGLRQFMPVLRRIQDLGFRRFYTHLNPACRRKRDMYTILRSECYEVYYVNTRFARQPLTRK